MRTRILETTLKIHITSDLDDSLDLDAIGECVDIFRNYKYHPKFIEEFDNLRELRNQSMHNESSLGSSETIEIVRNVLQIVQYRN